MAFKKTLAQRLFNICRIPNPSVTNCRTTSYSAAAKALAASNNPDRIAPDPGDDGIFRQFLHRKPLYPFSMAGTPPELRSFPTGAGLVEKLREMDLARNRIRLDVLSPPPEVRSDDEESKLTVADAKKLLKLSQLEIVKARLRQTERNCVSHAEFIEICVEACGNRDQGKEYAKMLDESGTVIILGNFVFLRPEQVG